MQVLSHDLDEVSSSHLGKMAKRIFVSSHVSPQIKTLQNCDGFVYGLVLGHFTGKDLMVIHWARTPIEEGEAAVEGEEQTGPKSMSEVDPEWVAEHVKLVKGMLPGGIDVQGMFFVSQEEIFKKHEQKINSCLKKIKQTLNVDEPLLWPVFHVNKSSAQTKVVSLSDPVKCKMTNFEESDMQWLCLKANLILDQVLAFTEEKTNNRTFKEKLESAVKKLQVSLDNSTMIINGRLRKGTDQLVAPKPPKVTETKSKGKKGKKDTKYDDVSTEASCDELDNAYGGCKNLKEFDVDILFGESCSTLDDCVVADVMSRMQITGRMCARAFVHQNATVEQAVNALKIDIMRTFRARLELHCDSLVGEEMKGPEEEDIPILHEPPRRVNIQLPQSPVSVSDLLFPGETHEESVKSMEEVFGFTPNYEHLDDELEIVASPQTIRVSSLIALILTFSFNMNYFSRWMMNQEPRVLF